MAQRDFSQTNLLSRRSYERVHANKQAMWFERSLRLLKNRLLILMIFKWHLNVHPNDKS